jgi:hypothetical protein
MSWWHKYYNAIVIIEINGTRKGIVYHRVVIVKVPEFESFVKEKYQDQAIYINYYDMPNPDGIIKKTRLADVTILKKK